MQGLKGRAGLKRDFSDIVPSTFPTTATASVSLSRTSSSETTSSSWDFDLNPVQTTAANRNHQSMDTEHSTYDDSSPIIPSLSPPPMDDRRHSPLLSPASIQPSRKPSKTVTPSEKNHQQKPQIPFDTLEKDLDMDPITEFDSDEDSNCAIVTDELVDEPILNSLAPASTSALTTSLATPRGRRKEEPNPRWRESLLPHVPQQPKNLVSPGRQKFRLPLSSPAKQGTGPPSPAQNLRPVSELSRILLASSPASSSTVGAPATSIPVPPTGSKPVGTSPAEVRRTTYSKELRAHITTTAASASKLKLTDIARSLNLPAPAPGIQKQSPSGSKPHRITNDIKKEQQNAQTKTRYDQKMNSDGKRKANDSMDEYRGPSKFNHVKQEKEQEKEQEKDESRPNEVTKPLLKSQTPGSASTEYDDTSPILPLTNYKIPSINDNSLPITQSEKLSASQEKHQLEDQEQQRQENERKKQELLSEVYAMRRTLKSSSSSAATLLAPFLPPPSTPTSTSLSSTEQHDATNLVQISEEDRIPIPDDILGYVPKLTPIDQIKWAPVKEGRYHIFALIMAIEPMEVIAAKSSTSNNDGSSSGFQKVLVSVCDQSATSFKVVLWREKANWVYLFKPGDAVLFTDLQMKEFRNKISGNSSSWSKMSRVDGSAMARYKGSKGNPNDPASAMIETVLRLFVEKRRVLALDLLDPDKGIARAPSCYLSPSMSLLSPQQYPQEQRQQQIWPGSTTSTAATTRGSVIATAILGPPRPIARPLPTTPIARPSSIKSNILPSVVSGASVRASVVYRMLIEPNEDNAGWEIGAVMANGRFVKVQSTSKMPTWINKIVPGKLMNFFGRFTKTSDGVVFSLDGARDPASLSENAWGNSIKQIELKRFRTIRSLREHQFMGDAIVEEASILTVRFPNLTSDYNVDDDNQDAMFSFIRCYCKGCESPTVASPQNPSILFCPHCHLDPQRRQTSTLEWCYPPFEITLTDRTSRLGASLSVEMIQVRCQMELGNQIFSEVPADQWMTSGDEAQFWKCRGQWVQIMKHLNNEDQVEDNQMAKSEAQDPSGPFETRKKKVKVEVRVGLNFVAKGLSIRYL